MSMEENSLLRLSIQKLPRYGLGLDNSHHLANTFKEQADCKIIPKRLMVKRYILLEFGRGNQFQFSMYNADSMENKTIHQ